MMKRDTLKAVGRVTLYVTLAGVAVFAAISWIPRPPKRALELPSGSVYYKGPMKTKGGKANEKADPTAIDDLNPDIPDNAGKH